MSKDTTKRVLFLAMIGGTWLLYLVTNLINNGRKAYDVSIGVDRLIPFVPFFILFYLSWWVLVWLPIFLSFNNLKLLKRVTFLFVSLNVVSNLIFLLFPTTIIRPEIMGRSIVEQLTGLFYTLDAPYNLFPSLHISSLVASYCMVYYLKRSWAQVLLPWFLVVLISPLFIKQHSVIDVMGGLVLGWLAFYIFFNHKNSPPSSHSNPVL